jgi:hypothetical protein
MNTLEIGNPPTSPSPNPKNKKLGPLNLLIGCMQFLFPNQFVTNHEFEDQTS